MATTSSGLFKLLSVLLLGAVGLAAAALFRVADPVPGSALELHARSSWDFVPERTALLSNPQTISNRERDSEIPRHISAENIDRSLIAAPPGTQDMVLERMLTKWIDFDPPAAARYAELQIDPFLRQVAERTVALRWTQIDQEAAGSWAASLGDDAERSEVISAVALTMSDSEPRAALALLHRYGAEAYVESTRAGVVTNWATRDFAAAQAWVEAQPPGPARDAIVLRLTVLRAQSDPAAAAMFANEMLSDDAARRDAFASIFQPWATRDPDAARAWAATAYADTRDRIDAELTIKEQPRN